MFHISFSYSFIYPLQLVRGITARSCLPVMDILECDVHSLQTAFDLQSCGPLTFDFPVLIRSTFHCRVSRFSIVNKGKVV